MQFEGFLREFKARFIMRCEVYKIYKYILVRTFRMLEVGRVIEFSSTAVK